MDVLDYLIEIYAGIKSISHVIVILRMNQKTYVDFHPFIEAPLSSRAEPVYIQAAEVVKIDCTISAESISDSLISLHAEVRRHVERLESTPPGTHVVITLHKGIPLKVPEVGCVEIRSFVMIKRPLEEGRLNG